MGAAASHGCGIVVWWSPGDGYANPLSVAFVNADLDQEGPVLDLGRGQLRDVQRTAIGFAVAWTEIREDAAGTTYVDNYEMR